MLDQMSYSSLESLSSNDEKISDLLVTTLLVLQTALATRLLKY